MRTKSEAKTLTEEAATNLMVTTGWVSEADAKGLLRELRMEWERETAELQRSAHDTMRPYFHVGMACVDEDCHVRRIIAVSSVDGA
jgi:hypothetical protein